MRQNSDGFVIRLRILLAFNEAASGAFPFALRERCRGADELASRSCGIRGRTRSLHRLLVSISSCCWILRQCGAIGAM